MTEDNEPDGKWDREEKPWQDRKTLRKLYRDKRMSPLEIAEMYGNITAAGIRYWIDKHDIEKRSMSEAARLRWLKEPPNVFTGGLGYMTYCHELDGKQSRLLLHRLLAVAEYGFDAVKDKHIHHKNGVRWDNRPDNIELLSPSEHQTKEIIKRGSNPDLPWRDEERLRKLYETEKLSIKQIADRFGCEPQTVRRWMIKYGIERRPAKPYQSQGESSPQQTTLDKGTQL